MFTRTVGFGLLALLATPSTSAAQTLPAATLYRLTASASFEEGCQPPCECVLWPTDDLFGTMTVAFDHSDPSGFDHYDVENVNWVYTLGNAQHRVTGKGEYRVGGPVALLQQLRLDLSIDGGPTIAFDSGIVAGGASFPTIDVAIAQNGFYCYDRVFTVAASPVPASELAPYVLGRSGCFIGCFDPCDCPLAKFRLAGGFSLVDLGPTSDPLQRHHALVDVDWHTVPTPAPRSQAFRGFGIYTRHVGTMQQRLVCDLTDGNNLTQRFDSGLVLGGGLFPARIDADLSVNGFYCYDTALLIHARAQ
jgi:hypothetical protein